MIEVTLVQDEGVGAVLVVKIALAPLNALDNLHITSSPLALPENPRPAQ